MKYLHTLTILAVALACSCGSAQTGSNPPRGSNGGNPDDDDLDVADHATTHQSTEDGQDTTDGTGDVAVGEQPPVTFRLKNSAADELVFSLDRGWQPVIFGFSGKPPNAKAIVMFPKFCTAACDVAETERCPSCPQPEKVKDIRAAEKREVVAPGSKLDVPWDGQIFVYKETRAKQDGRKTTCECHTREPVPPETYTVRACGLRLTKVAAKSTKLQCVEGKMTFPASGPQVVELDFPAP